jgi:hypothetical protein
MAHTSASGNKFMSIVFGTRGKAVRKFTIDRYVVANVSIEESKKELLRTWDGKVFWGEELRQHLARHNFNRAEIEDTEHFAEKYVSRSMDSPEQILTIPRGLLWLFVLYALFAWIISPLYTSKLVDLINQELQPDHPVTLFQVALGLSFTLMGFVTFLWAAIGYPIQQALICYKYDYVKNTARFKEQFFSPVPKKIMSLGVIPMIFSICGIIFFKEDQLLDTLAYFTLSTEYRLGMDPLKLLLLCGGLAECAAFFLGYLFPETSSHGAPVPVAEQTKAAPAIAAAPVAAAPVAGATTIVDVHEPVTVVTNRNLLTDDQLKRLLSSVRINLKLDLKE